ncbi:MAG: hypothetical protein MZV63_09735, partial [Marinilabiliales bacterium]|nr:hypothetical protein [Marinilabiliales bacterium]
MTDRFLDGDATNNAPVAGVDAGVNWHGGGLAGPAGEDRGGLLRAWASPRSGSRRSARTRAARSGRRQPPDDGVSLVLADLHGLARRRCAAGHSRSNRISGIWRAGGLVALQLTAIIRILVDLVANHVQEDSPLDQPPARQPAVVQPPGGGVQGSTGIAPSPAGSPPTCPTSTTATRRSWTSWPSTPPGSSRRPTSTASASTRSSAWSTATPAPSGARSTGGCATPGGASTWSGRPSPARPSSISSNKVLEKVVGVFVLTLAIRN